MKTFYRAQTLTCVLLAGLSFASSKPVAGQEASGQKVPETQDAEEAPTEPKVEPFQITVAEDNIHFSVSGTWKNVPPRSGMLEAELKIPKVGEDDRDGRLTIMGAGGSIADNIERWQGQFLQPDGTATKAETVQKTIADQTVSIVDISGTFLDAPGGPFSGRAKVQRDNYRMLAAIIETAEYGNYFVKLYGPKTTIDKNEKAFKAMIESLKVTD